MDPRCFGVSDTFGVCDMTKIAKEPENFEESACAFSVPHGREDQ